MTNNIYNPDFVKNLFNKMSSSYERMNYVTSFGFSIRWRKQCLNSLPASNDRLEIIDLMTGMGETWNSLARRFPNATISALDFSTEMLKKAAEKNKHSFSSKIKLLEEDMLNNSLADEQYDCVVCAYGLKTFDETQLTILATEVKRILKKGGRFTFVEVSKPTHPLLKLLYGFYLGSVIPILGKIMLGDPTEYKMLWKYVENFQNAENVNEIFNKVGLKSTNCSYFYGCATGIMGYKDSV